MSASLAYDSRAGLPYGTNPLELLIGSSSVLPIDNSRIAISPNGLKTKNGMPIFSALTTSTGLLRGAKSLTYNVTGSSGKTVSRTVEQDAAFIF